MDKEEKPVVPEPAQETVDVEKEKKVLDLLKQLAQKQAEVSRLRHARNVRKQKDKITGVIRKVETAAENYRKGKKLDSNIDSLKKALATLEKQYETGLKGFERRRQALQAQESKAIARLLNAIASEKTKLSFQIAGNMMTQKKNEARGTMDRIDDLDELEAVVKGEKAEVENDEPEYSDRICELYADVLKTRTAMQELEEEEAEFEARDEWSVDRLELASDVQSNEARKDLIPQQNRLQRFVGFIVNKFSALRKTTPKQLHANIQEMIDKVENVNIPSAVDLAEKAAKGVKEWAGKTAAEFIAEGQSLKMDIIKRLESKILAADQEINGQQSGKTQKEQQDMKDFADIIPDEEAFL